MKTFFARNDDSRYPVAPFLVFSRCASGLFSCSGWQMAAVGSLLGSLGLANPEAEKHARFHVQNPQPVLRRPGRQMVPVLKVLSTMDSEL